MINEPKMDKKAAVCNIFFFGGVNNIIFKRMANAMCIWRRVISLQSILPFMQLKKSRKSFN